MKKYVLSLLVQNNFGVLARISSLFARKGNNIHSLNVSPTNDPTISKITVVVMGDEEMAEKTLKQVSKLEETISVTKLEENSTLCKELVLIKLLTNDKETCSRVNQIGIRFQAKLLYETPKFTALELTDAPSIIDSFVNQLDHFNIIGISRTGATALEL